MRRPIPIRGLIAGPITVLLAALLAIALPPAAALDALPARALALDLDAARLLPDATRDFTVRVGSQAAEATLREVWVQIDSGPLVRHLYSPQEAAALRVGGLHVLLAAPLSPGRHRIRAQAAAVGLDPRRSDARSRAAVELHVDKGDAPLALELSWTPAAYVGKAALAARVVADDDAVAAARELRFLDATGSRYRGERLWQRLHAADAGLLRTGVEPATAEPPASPASDRPCTAAVPDLACDRANATLGYTQLERGEGLAAAESFRRVRAPGPYATAALLGLGWALLVTPDARAAAKAEALAERPGRAPRHPVRAMKPKEHDDAIRAALVPWIELIGRDPTDPAVQEGQLAVAWALAELGAQVQAQDHYNRVIEQLTGLLARIDKARAELAAAPLLASVLAAEPDSAWHWSLADQLPDPRWWVLPVTDTREAFHLEALLQQPAFRDEVEQLREHHEARAALLGRRAALAALDSAAASGLIAAIDPLLATLDLALAEHSRRIDRLALAQLLATRRQAGQALVEARFGLVQLYDRPAEVASK